MDDFFRHLPLPHQARFLRSILLTSRDGFWLVNRQGRIVEVNEAYIRLSGYTRQELLTKGIADLTMVEQPHETALRMQRIIENGSELFETQHRIKDGRVIDIELSVTYLDMDEGYFICFCRDISQRKKTEKDYRVLFQEMLDGFARHEIICDSEGKPVDYRFLAVNSAFEKMTGLKSEDLVGRTVLEIMPDIEPSWIEKYGKVALNGEAIHFEEFSSPLGKHFEVRAFCPAPKQFACLFMDITERKRVEAERQRLVAAMEQVGDIVVMTDPQGVIQYVNPAFQKVSGYSREEVVGQNPRILKSGVQDNTFYEQLWGTITSGKTWHGRMVNKCLDGSQYTEEATISPVCDSDGKIINYMAVKRDITPMLDLEKRVLQAEKMEAMGVLAGGIAHDFNNILFPIIGFAELLLEDLKDNEILVQKVLEIFNGAKRAADLVQQILAFGRQTTAVRRPINVQTVVREVLSLARSVIPTNFSLEGDMGADPCIIHADSTHLHQMVMNLITNAYQAMQGQNGGVIKVSVTKKAPDTADTSGLSPAAGAYVDICVSDTGSGIDPQDLGRVFEPYFTTKQAGKGTGLGLAMVHGLVREYDGEVRVESEVGMGSTFSLLIPAMDSLGDTTNPEFFESPVGKERILVVDDESAIVRMETIVLQRLGYTVSGYSMGGEALEAFMAEPDRFDLVITDMAMPVMTGLQLARRILAQRPDLPILMCTGFSEQIDHQRVQALGIKGLLMKPLLNRDLAMAVRKLLDESIRARIRGRILVIDDESGVRHLFREKLSSEHCEVLEAADGSKGLAICRKERLDLVVTDLVMPDKEGIETIMELCHEYPELPVLAISGGGRSGHSEDYLSLAERLGAKRVFSKPIDWSQFYRALVDFMPK